MCLNCELSSCFAIISPLIKDNRPIVFFCYLRSDILIY